MATWAEFERAEPELAAFGRDRLDGTVCFQATLRPDGSPRVHPVEPWIAAGLLLVRFRARSPKVARGGARRAVTRCTRRWTTRTGIGGEFLVNGWMEQVSPAHPATRRFAEESSEPLAFYALSVEEVVATTYEGDDPTPSIGAGGAIRRRGPATRRERRSS